MRSALGYARGQRRGRRTEGQFGVAILHDDSLPLDGLTAADLSNECRGLGPPLAALPDANGGPHSRRVACGAAIRRRYSSRSGRRERQRICNRLSQTAARRDDLARNPGSVIGGGKATTLAMSSGAPRRRSAVRLTATASNSAVSAPRVMSVTVVPCATAFTRTPRPGR